MSEKNFDCFEERLSDLTKAIEKIRTVFTLRREMVRVSKERENLANTSISISADTTEILRSLDRISNEDIQKELSIIHDKYKNILNDLRKEIDALDNKFDKIEAESIQYLEYADTFFYVSEDGIIDELLKKLTHKECSNEDFFAILIILLNDCVSDADVVECKVKEYADKVEDNFRRHILFNIERYDHDAICRVIEEMV